MGPGATPGASVAPAAGPAATTRSKDDSTNSKTDLYPVFVGHSGTSLFATLSYKS